jgi:uncharacterized protein YijF (DUF1287 family)
MKKQLWPVSILGLLSCLAGSNLQAEDFAQRLAAAALKRTQHQVRYDPAYVRIPYPGGDVPADTGVCTDVIIRSYRQLGTDLQQEVHEDMRQHFSLYPDYWGLTKPDTNIDHRRVLNLRVFFARKGQSLDISQEASAYLPGDLVTWRLPGGLPHIGIVIDQKTEDAQRPLIVHNIGAGPKAEDILFKFPITGHYRYQKQH